MLWIESPNDSISYPPLEIRTPGGVQVSTRAVPGGSPSRSHTCVMARRHGPLVLIFHQLHVEREIIKVQDLGLITKVTPEEADVALTVFGYSCGQIRTEFERVPNSTVMFLKTHDERVLPALRAVDFSRFYRNTAYTEALSLQEIRFLINEEILGDPSLVKTKE